MVESGFLPFDELFARRSDFALFVRKAAFCAFSIKVETSCIANRGATVLPHKPAFVQGVPQHEKKAALPIVRNFTYHKHNFTHCSVCKTVWTVLIAVLRASEVSFWT